MLAEGLIVGWMRGRADTGRGLEVIARSARPRREGMKDEINERVKFRAEFRPFAPSTLDERGADYFEQYQSRAIWSVRRAFGGARARGVPAVVHVDGTGRLQSVRGEWDRAFYDLIYVFHARTRRAPSPEHEPQRDGKTDRLTH